MWLARHTPSTVLPVLHRLLSSLNEEFADAIANGGGVYGVGYCFGAKYILLLGSNLDDDVAAGQREHSAESKAEEGMVKKGPAIKVGTLAHGTMVGREDFKDVKVPMGMVCVEDDALFPDDVREYGVKALKDKGVEVENWVYPGVPHGESRALLSVQPIADTCEVLRSLVSTRIVRYKRRRREPLTRCWDFSSLIEKEAQFSHLCFALPYDTNPNEQSKPECIRLHEWILGTERLRTRIGYTSSACQRVLLKCNTLWRGITLVTRDCICMACCATWLGDRRVNSDLGSRTARESCLPIN